MGGAVVVWDQWMERPWKSKIEKYKKQKWKTRKSKTENHFYNFIQISHWQTLSDVVKFSVKASKRNEFEELKIENVIREIVFVCVIDTDWVSCGAKIKTRV